MISKIILGTAQFGLDYGINNSSGKINPNEVDQILRYAHSRGVLFLDTAQAYGNAEDLIGRFHRDNSLYFKIITKFKLAGHFSVDSYIEATLKTLNIQSIDVLMFHSFEDYIESQVNNDLLYFKQIGLIKNIGVSIYSNDELSIVINDPQINLIQVPFNLLDSDRNKIDLLKEGKRKGKVIHSRSTFLQGLFFKDIQTLDEQFNPIKSQLLHLHDLSKRFNIDIQDLAINYVLRKRYIDNTIIGVDNLNHLIKNFDAVGRGCNQKILDEIDNLRVEDLNILNPKLWRVN